MDTGEVTLIEALGRPVSMVPAAAAQTLGVATAVIAESAPHPNLLGLLPSDASLEVTPDALERAVTRAQTGACVVALTASITAPHLALLEASGVSHAVLPGIPAEHYRPRSGALRGRRILVTRPLPAARAQRDLFLERGADAVALPCLRIDPPDDPDAFHQRLAQLDTFDGIILSSRAGVDALRSGLAALDTDVRALAGLTLAVVGSATAASAETIGLRPDLVARQQRSEGIVQTLGDAGLLGKRWLHVRARDGRPTLGEAISQAGGHFELAVAYQASRPEPPPGVVDWIRAGVDAVCLHSGRTGMHLRALAQQYGFETALQRAAVFSAGPITTKALQEQGFIVTETAESPGDAGMCAVVSRHLAGG